MSAPLRYGVTDSQPIKGAAGLPARWTSATRERPRKPSA